MKKRKISRKRKKFSRKDVRVLTILSIIEGAVIQAGQSANPLLFNRVSYAQQHCKIATNSWVIVGQEGPTINQVQKKLRATGEKLNEVWWLKVKPEMNTPGMLYISMQLLDDLMRQVKLLKKSKKLENIFDALEILLEELDPEGEMKLTQDRAKEVVDIIYSVVGEDHV